MKKRRRWPWVGMDRLDSGGIERQKGESFDAGDLVFKVDF